MFIQPSKAELLDEIFKYWEKTNLKFGHVVDSVNNDVSYRRTGNTLFSLSIRLDDKSATYGRVADEDIDILMSDRHLNFLPSP